MDGFYRRLSSDDGMVEDSGHKEVLVVLAIRGIPSPALSCVGTPHQALERIPVCFRRSIYQPVRAGGRDRVVLFVVTCH